MQARISMITLGVKDLNKSVGFYEKGLSFPRLDYPSPDVAFFKLNGSWLGLYGFEALAKDAKVSHESSGFSGIALAHNVKSEKEVHEVFDAALLAGARTTKEPQKVFWGGYSGYFKDPDGYLWEVAYNPYFWIGPTDS